MSVETPTSTAVPRQRADARRNRAKLVTAAREAFARDGTSASLEDIARRAEVGIGTLYRHFPTRLDLVEAIYVDEVEALCDSAGEVAGLAPWDALVGWLRRVVSYVAAKQALAEELFAHMGPDAEVFMSCRVAIYTTGEPLLARAQQTGAVRPDTDFDEVIRMVGAIAKIAPADPDQIARILDIALDGLRFTLPLPAHRPLKEHQ
jgi:AcrR family transcriptional regulator